MPKSKLNAAGIKLAGKLLRTPNLVEVATRFLYATYHKYEIHCSI